jgi:hypothetical protein
MISDREVNWMSSKRSGRDVAATRGSRKSADAPVSSVTIPTADAQTVDDSAANQQPALFSGTQEYFRVEKQIIAMGVFTATRKRNRKKSVGIKEVPIRHSDALTGRRVEGKVTIRAPQGSHLPTTADLEKHLVFEEIALEQMRRNGGVLSNPVRFDAADMLRRLGLDPHSGHNVDEVWNWMKRTAGVTIESTVGVWHAGQKRLFRQNALVHIFDKVYQKGQMRDDGTAVAANEVYVSDWQLENISSYHQLPVNKLDFRALRREISKTLYPQLRVWLYRTESEGRFVKSYEDLTRLIGITTYRRYSEIARQLQDSLDELVRIKLLASWEIVPAKSHTKVSPKFNVIFHHGEGYWRDREELDRRREFAAPTELDAPEPTLAEPRQMMFPAEPTDGDSLPFPEIASALRSRGLAEAVVDELVRSVPPDRVRDVREMIALHDYKQRNGELKNAPGWLRDIVRKIAAGSGAYALPRAFRADVGEDDFAARESQHPHGTPDTTETGDPGVAADAYLASLASDEADDLRRQAAEYGRRNFDPQDAALFEALTAQHMYRMAVEHVVRERLRAR